MMPEWEALEIELGERLAKAEADLVDLRTRRARLHELVQQLRDLAAQFDSPICNSIRDPIHQHSRANPQQEEKDTA